MSQALKSSGTALITALFIMTLVAIAATAMSLRLQIEIRRTNLMMNSDNAYLAAQAVEFWAIGRLKKAAINSKDPSQKIDTLPLQFSNAAFTYPKIKVQGQLDDLQAKFNLNNLTQKNDIPRFALLLIAVDPNLNPEKANAIATALADWLSPYQANMTQTESDSYYRAQYPPFQKSHTLMVSISEFRLIQGVTADLYQKVAPYITALPKPTLININTAALPVLRTLGTGLTEQQAKLIVINRGQQGFNSMNELNQNPDIRRLALSSSQTTLVSNYFLSTAVARIGEQRLIVYNILERKSQNNLVLLKVLRQSLNVL